MRFQIKYSSTWENNIRPLTITEGSILRPLLVKWQYEGKDYEFIRDMNELITNIYVSKNYLLVLYAAKEKFSKTHPHPNNLVMYNLKKEVVKVIPPPLIIDPKVGKEKQGTIAGLNDVITYENRKYIEVNIL